MIRKHLKITFILFVVCLIGAGVFIFLNNNWKQALANPGPGSVYDFSGGAGTNKWAYEKGDAQPTSPANYESEATSGDYTAISSSDDSRWTTGLADADGEYDSQIYTFTINESVSDIIQIDIQWEGYGETESGYSTYLKIWNENSSSWEQLDSNDFTSATDATLSGAKTTNISNYIDASSKLSILATTINKLKPKRVFVTSEQYNGNLGGLNGADDKCQALADAAGLGGSWTAWVSTNESDASSRITHWDAGYILVNGTKVADNWSDLTDGTIDYWINRDESGNYFYGEYVWTNTKGDGHIKHTANDWTCFSFTSSSNLWSTRCGRNDYYDHYSWTDQGNKKCNLTYRLYCFEN